MEAREALAKDGIRAAVVSMPCWEWFETRSQEYRDRVLGMALGSRSRPPPVSAGIAEPGPRGAFIRMHGFGASAPGEALYPHFGITAERVAEAARSLL